MESILESLTLVIQLINDATENDYVIFENLEQLSFAIECELPDEIQCLRLVNQALALFECRKEHGLKLSISNTEVQNTLELGFNVNKIALHLSVSKSTIFRRMKAAGLSVRFVSYFLRPSV